jgi:hypothetical protein
MMRSGCKRLDVRHRHRVVAPHLHLGPQLAQVLDQVVGEGVVVVDHQYHDCIFRFAAETRMAQRNFKDYSPLTGFTHSVNSRGGVAEY